MKFNVVVCLMVLIACSWVQADGELGIQQCSKGNFDEVK